MNTSAVIAKRTVGAVRVDDKGNLQCPKKGRRRGWWQCQRCPEYQGESESFGELYGVKCRVRSCTDP